MAVGDIDRDGDLDLVCGNFGQPTTLYLSVSGRLQDRPAWSSGQSDNTASVALGDVDGDGDLDLVCGNTGQPTTLYLNIDGALQIQPAWTSGRTTFTVSVALADVDGDGDIDLVAGNRGQRTDLYLNFGGALLTQPISSGRADNTASITLGDVDGDGDLDVVCGNYAQPATLYLNVGGRIQDAPAWSSSIPSDPTTAVSLGDVDGDGDLDLVCGNTGQPTRLYLNVGGTFETGWPSWTSGRADFTNAVALGDVDDDGDLDLLCGNQGQSAAVYFGTGTTFGAQPAWYSHRRDPTAGVALADIDNDGDLDAFCGNRSRPTTLYLAAGKAFPNQPAWSSGQVNHTRSIALGDMDGDGDLDLVCGNTLFRYGPLGDQIIGVEAATAYLSSNGTFPSQPEWSSGPASATASIALGDVDGDGDLDLICGNYTMPTTLYLNIGGTLQTEPAWSSGRRAPTTSVALGDVDGDGDLDLVSGESGGFARLFLNVGGTFQSSPAWSSPRGVGVGVVTLGDVDGDGQLDLLCSNSWWSAGQGLMRWPVTLYLNVGGTFQAEPAWTSGRVDNTQSVAFGDVDSDGDLDVLCGNWEQPSTLYLNVGGMLQTQPDWYSGRADKTADVILHDVDGDGDLDLVCANSAQPTTMFLNVNGRLQTEPAWQSDTADLTSSVAIGDIDGHGRPDLVCGNDGYPTTLYRSQLSTHTVRTTNEDAFVRSANATAAEPTRNMYRIEFTATDRESDPVWVIAEYQLPGRSWTPIEDQPNHNRFGPFDTSPAGTQHELAWSTVRFPHDSRRTVVRLRSISNPLHGGLVQRIPVYFKDIGPINPVRPWIRLSADNLTFPSATAGDLSSLDFHISNQGTTTLTVSDLRVSDAGLSVVPPSPFVVAAGGSQPLRVFFRATRGGAFSNTLHIASSDPVDSLHTVAVAAQIRALDFTAPSLYPSGEIRQGQDVAVALTLTDSVHSDSAAVFYRQTGAVQYHSRRLQRVVDPPHDQYAGTISSDLAGLRGLEYYLVVYNGTASTAGPIRFLRVRVTDQNFPAPQPAERYRLVSMPLASSGSVVDNLADDLGPLDAVRWRLFRYAPGESVYQEISSEAPFSFELARAYWLITKSSTLLDVGPLGGVTAPSDRAYAVVLAPGWNLVSNPFNFSVAWSATVHSPRVSAPVAYDAATGGYAIDPPALLAPFEGYFVKNSAAVPETLFVPPIEMPPASLAVKARLASSAGAFTAAGAWRARLISRSTGGCDASCAFGVHPDASDGADPFDAEMPPSPPGSWVRLALVQGELPTRRVEYRSDIRGTQAAGQQWDIEVRSGERGRAVALDLLHDTPVPPGWALKLVDLEQSVTVDLPVPAGIATDQERPGRPHREPATTGSPGVYQILSYGPDRPYRLALLGGSAEYVARTTHDLAAPPIDLSMDQNAPNPFNATTRIRFGLPTPASVTLQVFDVRGDLVATLLHDSRQGPGYHSVLWNGTDRAGHPVASGVYLYRLQTPTGTFTRRLVIAK